MNNFLTSLLSYGQGQAPTQSLSQDAYRSVMDVTGNARNPAAASLFSDLGQGGASNGWMDPLNIFGGTRADGSSAVGWAPTALNLGQGLLSGYMGMKQYGLAKDRLGEARRQFNTNLNMQRKTINTQLEDRQRARVASNPGAYQSVSEYMNENRI